MPNSNHNNNGFAVGAGRTHDLTVEGISLTSGQQGAGTGPVQGPVRAVPAAQPVVAAPSIALPATAWQLVVILSDGSLSTGPRGFPLPNGQTRAEGMAEATSALLAELMKSTVKANFSIVWIPWAGEVLDTQGPMPLTMVDPKGDWNPSRYGGSGTRAAGALEAAMPIIRAYLAQAAVERMPVSVVTLLLSDGEDAEPARALRMAEELRSVEGAVTLGACRFGTDAAADDLLRQIATPGFYQAAHNAEELRAWFMRTITNAEAPRQQLPAGQG